jgi:hypothetical protein
VPRDLQGSFEPLLIPKHERRFDDKIVAMYARGMTMREIQGFLREQYGTEISAEFISCVTDEVMEEIKAWQSRPLEPIYPVVFFDALRVKVREDAVVRNKAIYLALGVLPDGTRDILGLWIENTEGAKFWMKVFNDLKTRGVADILIAVTDGLKGMAEALGAVFPATTLQTCIVHLIRDSLDVVSWRDRKALAAAIKPIYTAPSAEAAQAELDLLPFMTRSIVAMAVVFFVFSAVHLYHVSRFIDEAQGPNIREQVAAEVAKANGGAQAVANALVLLEADALSKRRRPAWHAGWLSPMTTRSPARQPPCRGRTCSARAATACRAVSGHPRPSSRSFTSMRTARSWFQQPRWPIAPATVKSSSRRPPTAPAPTPRLQGAPAR